MLELGAGADIFRALGRLYWVLMILLVALAMWLPKPWWRKAVGAIAVLVVFIVPVVIRSHERAQLADQRKARYEAAKAVFDERCKTAGERIYRTVENVEGVLLANIRKEFTDAGRHNPNWPDAGLPQQFGGEAYIYSFLAWENQSKPPSRGSLNGAREPAPVLVSRSGYKFVDAVLSDGKVYRYRLPLPPEYRMRSEPLQGATSPYAVSFENSMEDRAHWIAGTTVRVIDTRTNQLLAEKTWYSFERGFGSTAGGRQPWTFAITCPADEGGTGRDATRYFVDQILKPKQGD